MNDSYRILYALYKVHLRSRSTTIYALVKAYPYMHQDGHLRPTVAELRKNAYLTGPDLNLEITGKGITTIETFFRKFLVYMKLYDAEDLSYWINNLGLYRNQIQKLMDNIFFYVELKREPAVLAAFEKYLNEVESIESVNDFEIHEVNLGELIDEIFTNIEDINLLFEQRFNAKLFCQSLAAQPNLNKATRRHVDLRAVITVIGSVIDSICHKDIDALLGQNVSVNGSVNKIQKLLDANQIDYNENAIKTLRTLYNLRSKTYPIHNAGPAVIKYWQELQIQFPVVDDRKAAVKLLQALNSSLKEMKSCVTK